MGICLFRRCISNVTYAYYELDYIQSTGTQYIDTGYTKSSGDAGPIVKADIEFTASSSSLQCVLGCDHASTYQYHMYMGANTNNTWYLRWRNSEYSSSATWSLNTRYEFEGRLRRNDKYISINGTKVINNTSSESNYPSNGNFYLLANNQSSTALYPCYAKLYSSSLYEDSTLLRVWIPCLRASDDEVGLYDIKNNVFYPNAGTGKFSYGSIKGGLCSFK